MTVAPPSPRSQLVPALSVTALLCACLAFPAAAKPPADKGPPAHANGGGHAKEAKVKATPPGQAKKAARQAPAAQAPSAQAPAAQAVGPAKGPKKPKNPKARGNPHRAATAPAAPPSAAPAPSTGNGGAAGERRSTSRARRARAAQARRARAARSARARAARAERTATRTRATSGASLAAAPSGGGAGFADPGAAGFADPGAAASPAPEESTTARDNARRPPFEPVIPRDQIPQPLRVVRDVVEVIPTPLRFLVLGLGVLSVMLAFAWGLTAVRNRRLARQRSELLGEVGLLQAALLPDLPDTLASCRASVAYRPADGPGAGGDFYDVLPLAGGRTAILIGDVSGHGRAALARTALARYTLRAYAEAGLEPREAIQIAGAVLAGKLEGDFVTALIAVHDAAAGTLTYATAGHPPPIVLSSMRFDPVIAGTPPPLGVGASTGQRQTTVPFPRGAVACFYTDGLSEARTADGRLGTDGLERLVEELGPDLTAREVIDRVAGPAGTLDDDAAVCVIAAEEGAALVRSRVERLEVSRGELRGAMPAAFLAACGVSLHAIRRAEREARDLARRTGGAILEVRMGEHVVVEVRPTELPVRDDALTSGAERV